MPKYRVHFVDKYHGSSDADDHEIVLSDAAFQSNATLAKALRAARVLVAGQSIREVRPPRSAKDWAAGLRLIPGRVVVFPNNAPGLTTGIHSLTLTAVDAIEQIDAAEFSKILKGS